MYMYKKNACAKNVYKQELCVQMQESKGYPKPKVWTFRFVTAQNEKVKWARSRKHESMQKYVKYEIGRRRVKLKVCGLRRIMKEKGEKWRNRGIRKLVV